MNFDRPTNMPATWPNGKPRSTCNAFAAAYFVHGTPGTALPRARPGPKATGLVLNTSGRPQATLARAKTNNITLTPAMTLEQEVAAAIRNSQIDRPLRAAKRAMAKAA